MNSDQKLDRVIQLLEGDGPDAPGVIGRLRSVERLVYGSKGDLGLNTRVRIMWRMHVWLLCTASAIIGSGLTLLLRDVVLKLV